MRAALAALALVLPAAGAAAQDRSMTSLAPAAAPSSFGHYQPPRQFTEQIKSSFYVTMRDGTKIAVLVARPAKDGKPVEGRFPVIWHHTLTASQQPGDGTGPRSTGFSAIPNLTDHGYVVVQVARRGNGQSFGTMRGYHDRNEAHDAYELIEWLAAQPWSDGNVGQYGCSNTGDAALQAMTVNAPHLKAVFAGCFSWNKYDAMRRGGIFAQWGTGPTRTIDQDMAIPPVDTDPDKTMLRRAAEQHQRGVPLFDVWKALPFRDSFSPQLQSTFWFEGSGSSYLPQIRQGGVPLYIVGGWRDELRDQGLIARMNIPGARILIGDWLHCMSDGFALAEEAHRFFDRHLKHIDTGIDAQDPIHYFAVGANLFAYVEDVAPDGTVRVITEGRLKASLRKPGTAPWAMPGGIPWHRAFAEDAQPLTAGEPARLTFDVMPTSWLFRKGHRVQVTFTGSDWRESARDANSQPKTVTLISDTAHPSTISLPLIGLK